MYSVATEMRMPADNIMIVCKKYYTEVIKNKWTKNNKKTSLLEGVEKHL